MTVVLTPLFVLHDLPHVYFVACALRNNAVGEVRNYVKEEKTGLECKAWAFRMVWEMMHP